MPFRTVNILYYISIIATASIATLAIDWRPGAGTGFVIHEPEIWWALLSLFITLGLNLYRKKRREGKSE